VPGGGTCELLVVEGLYCVKQNPDKEALVEIVLLNTIEEAINVNTERLAGQSISLCCRAGMNMPGAKLPVSATAATVSAPGKIEKMMTSDRTEEIIKELQLEHKPLLKAARNLITKYADVFTPKSEGQVGLTNLVELDIKMKPGTPFRQRVRPLNPTMQESLDEQTKTG
jgi:hypothetical protein